MFQRLRRILRKEVYKILTQVKIRFQRPSKALSTHICCVLTADTKWWKSMASSVSRWTAYEGALKRCNCKSEYRNLIIGFNITEPHESIYEYVKILISLIIHVSLIIQYWNYCVMNKPHTGRNRSIKPTTSRYCFPITHTHNPSWTHPTITKQRYKKNCMKI